MQTGELAEKETVQWKWPVILSIAIVLFYFLISTQTTLWDRDEPRFSRAAAEMVESGNYLYPTFNGVVRAHKPILVYWCMTLPIALFGSTELACRMVSNISLGITCLLTFYIACKLINKKAGLWSILILAFSGLTFSVGSAATADSLLLVFMTAQMAVFVSMISSRIRVLHCVLMTLALAGALLTKGPVGALPILIMMIYLFRNRCSLSKTAPLFGLLILSIFLATGLFLLWAIQANNATNGEFVRFGLKNQFIDRLTQPIESHGGNDLLFLPYYLVIILFAFFPWTLILPGAVSGITHKHLGKHHCSSLMAIWFLTVFIIVTLVRTKLPNYILSVWPLLAICTGGVLDLLETNSATQTLKKGIKNGLWITVPVGLLIGLALIIGPWFLPLKSLILPSCLSGLILMLVILLICYQVRTDTLFNAGKTIAISSFVFISMLAFWMMPIVDKTKLMPKMAQALKNYQYEDIAVTAYYFNEPSVNFYMAKPIEELRGPAKSLVDWATRDSQGILILERKYADILTRKAKKLQLNVKEIAAVEGANLTKSLDPIELVAFLRNPNTDEKNN